MEGGSWESIKEQQETRGGNESVHHCGCGDDLIGICICQMYEIVHSKFVQFFTCQLNLNKTIKMLVNYACARYCRIMRRVTQALREHGGRVTKGIFSAVIIDMYV